MFPYEGELQLLRATAQPAYRCTLILPATSSVIILTVRKREDSVTVVGVSSSLNSCVYSREEILSLLELARSKSMEVIPLVQTFGHMEVRLMCFLLGVMFSV